MHIPHRGSLRKNTNKSHNEDLFLQSAIMWNKVGYTKRIFSIHRPLTKQQKLFIFSQSVEVPRQDRTPCRIRVIVKCDGKIMNNVKRSPRF